MEETKRTNANNIILVVEDEETVRKIIELVLRSSGYCVVTAGSAVEAAKAVNEYRAQIRLALVDFSLPDRDGLWVATCIAKETSAKVAIMSGYDKPNLHVRLPDNCLFLMKPFDPPTLRRKVKEFLA